MVFALYACPEMASADDSPSGLAENGNGAAALHEVPVSEDDRDHWAFQPLTRPVLPVVKTSSWLRNPIDAFVLKELEAEGIQPSAEASRTQLLRRLKFDLHGLPPTADEVRAFLGDSRPDAYEKLVDRLLDAPEFGQRWAIPWLDLARYAETDGFEHDKVRKGAWQYRDWLIRAINRDLPYDEFVRQQLVGDQLGGEEKVATMFCMAGPDMPDINEQDLRRHDKLNELAGTVASAFLGLQMQCAQCHDHKYDPISQLDFYRLRAVFESSVPQMKRDAHVLYLENSTNIEPARLYVRGELQRPGPVVEPAFPRIAVSEGQSHVCESDNPRRELSDWIASPENPLASRVIVNRIWQVHFGRSLTENPSDFGVVAGGPSHPELLDWMACELQRRKWSLKWLHRTIVLSATYRQAGEVRDDRSSGGSPSQHLDLFAAFPRKRLEGEVIRDSMLAVSGQLNREMDGPGVMPPLPDEMVGTLLKGQWKTSKNSADHVRRSIYTFARRNLRYPIFDVFDRPDAGASCAMRDRSTTATQSLHMLNGPFSLDCAQKAAAKLLASFQGSRDSASDPFRDQLVQRLFLQVLSRPADAVEQAWMRELLAEGESLEDQLTIACLAMMNSSEFIYVD